LTTTRRCRRRGSALKAWGWRNLDEYFPRAILEASIERGCESFVTGNATTRCRLEFVQAEVREFRELAEAEAVALVNATHYGMEKPPQLAMVEWFPARGLDAEFRPGRPE
jgi:hypothetical protein